MIKDIFLPLIGTVTDESALSAALSLAGQLDAHLHVQIIIEQPLPMPPEFGLIPDSLYASQIEAAREQAQSLATHVRARLAGLPMRAEVRMGNGHLLVAARAAALHALHADLTVMGGRPPVGSAENFERFFVEVLKCAGRPVLVVPAGKAFTLPFKHVVVAWQPTPEARRALQEALPLMGAAATVDVLQIDPVTGTAGTEAPPGVEICAHLARHGLPARSVIQRDPGCSTAAALLRHGQDCGADLLVAGGYSHSRLRELILGGVTRELLRSADLPVLFAH